MMRACYALTIFLLAAAPACTQKPKPLTDNPSARPFDHSAFDALLRKHVDGRGQVDYAGLRADRAKLRAYLDQLGRADWEKLKDRKERFAFWINAYNACCLEGVLRTLPADRREWRDYSVRKVSGFFDALAFKVSGEQVTLDHIEHKVLRVQFGDARLHFAIVCASIGCPHLRAEAYVAGKLDAQLDAQARAFVADPAKVKIDAGKRQLRVSKIFKWFGGDFEKESGSVPRFLARFVSDERLARQLKQAKWDVGYLEYDWSLNQR